MPAAIDDELRAFLKKAKLPSSPAVAAKILELTDEPDATVDDFARAIQMDPALSARLLSMTNSAACAQRSPVTTIQRAIGLLGINRVRTLALGFQLVSHLNRLGKCPFDMKAFWQQSVLRGCLARTFAEEVVPAYAEEAFLVGLLQDCGTLLLVQLLGKPYADLCRGTLSPSNFFAAEKDRFRHDHVQATCALAREWKLPERLIHYLGKQHVETPLTDASTDVDRMSAISYLAGSVRFSDNLHADEGEPGLAQHAATLGLCGDILSSCLEVAGAEYVEMSQILGDIIPEDLDVTDLLSEANRHLTTTVETERKQAAQEQTHLKNALGEYRERAARDPLTGVLNRGALTDALTLMLEESVRRQKALSMFFLDLDNFKKLNDVFGHAAGDIILVGVAETLKSQVSSAGIVARYGGEEFLLAMLGLTHFAAEQFADTIVSAIRNTPFPQLKLSDPVTCSVGALWAGPDAGVPTEQLLRTADQLMYTAKKTGKNRACFQRLGSANEAQSADLGPEMFDVCMNALQDAATLPHGVEVAPEVFQRIASELKKNAPTRFVDMRKQSRQDLTVPCRLSSFAVGTSRLVHDDAYVRNLSTGGIGLLTARRIPRGQPAEVTLFANGQPRLYIAGLVAYSRHVEQVVHETGLQIFLHAKEPILSRDPISAIRNLNWVANAIRSHHETAPA